MDAERPFPVILHLRVPAILEGRDHLRYFERKFDGHGVRLRPPPVLIGTDIPVGYGLVRPPSQGWCVVEARGEIPSHRCVIELHQHELVEEVMDEALELWRRAEREEGRVAIPPVADDEPEGGFASGGPMPHPITMGTIWVVLFVLKPLIWISRGITSMRRWYVREYG